jgi:hypothetical protein
MDAVQKERKVIRHTIIEEKESVELKNIKQ